MSIISITSKRKALAIGRSVCHHYKSSYNWVAVYPWKTENPRGAKCETQTIHYKDVVRMTAANVAEVALYQWCESKDIPGECIAEGYNAIWHAREDLSQPGDARHFLNVGIKRVLAWKELLK